MNSNDELQIDVRDSRGLSCGRCRALRSTNVLKVVSASVVSMSHSTTTSSVDVRTLGFDFFVAHD